MRFLKWTVASQVSSETICLRFCLAHGRRDEWCLFVAFLFLRHYDSGRKGERAPSGCCRRVLFVFKNTKMDSSCLYLLIWQLCSTKFHTLYQSIGWVAFCGVLRRTFVYEIDCRVIYLLVVERYWRLRSDQKWTALITGVNCFVMQFYYSKDQC